MVDVGGFPVDVHIDVPCIETVEAMIEAEKTAKDSTVKALGADEMMLQRN